MGEDFGNAEMYRHKKLKEGFHSTKPNYPMKRISYLTEKN